MDTRTPWLLEPDFKRWIDPATGLKCAIIRNCFGALCGYVRLPMGKTRRKVIQAKRRKGATYDHPVFRGISVHGGLTFFGTPENHKVRGRHWIGFDCGHHGDLSPFLSTNANFPEWLRLSLDTGVYRDFPYTAAEVTALAKQVRALP
jgi:hypothetical protein